MWRHKIKIIVTSLALSFILVWLWFVYFDSVRNPNLVYGVSFDPEYAGSLHVDPATAFHTIVNDWKFKYVRLPLHWDKLEAKAGSFDFSEGDYYLAEAAKAGAKITLAIGNKTPRWPECHAPQWAKDLDAEMYKQALHAYLQTTVEHYKSSPALEMWQVENEPFLAFGECMKLSTNELQDEISFVKSLDPDHPIIVGDSGELSSWLYTGTAADYFGTTMYRVVWNKFIGYWNYDWIPPAFYRWKLRMARRPLKTAFVIELQAEPWAPDESLDAVPLAEQSKSMNIERLKKNIDFAGRVGVSRAYLWGSEWWSWLRQNGQNEIPDFISTLNR